MCASRNKTLPVSNIVGSDCLGTLDTFTEVRVNWRTGYRFQTLQLTGRCHVESLHKIVKQANRKNDNQEHVR